jgi:hypothetical protein
MASLSPLALWLFPPCDPSSRDISTSEKEGGHRMIGGRGELRARFRSPSFFWFPDGLDRKDTVFRLSLTQPGEKRENGDVEQKNSEDSSCDVIDKVLRYL